MENNKLINFRFDLDNYFNKCKEKIIRREIKNKINFVDEEDNNKLDENELILTNNYKRKYNFNKTSIEEFNNINNFFLIIDNNNFGGGTTFL